MTRDEIRRRRQTQTQQAATSQVESAISSNSDNVPVEDIKKMIDKCDNFTTLKEVEKRMKEWDEEMVKSQIEKILRLNPMTACVVGALTVAEEFSDLAGVVSGRILGAYSSYEFICKAAIMSHSSEAEHLALEGLLELFQTLINNSCNDPKIIAIKEELEIVWHNC